MAEHELGDGPIEDAHRAQMNAVASALDDVFNGEARGGDRQTGFVVLVFPYREKHGRCNFISNGADRRDLAKMFKGLIKRFEDDDQPKVAGRA